MRFLLFDILLLSEYLCNDVPSKWENVIIFKCELHILYHLTLISNKFWVYYMDVVTLCTYLFLMTIGVTHSCFLFEDPHIYYFHTFMYLYYQVMYTFISYRYIVMHDFRFCILEIMVIWNFFLWVVCCMIMLSK